MLKEGRRTMQKSFLIQKLQIPIQRATNQSQYGKASK